MIGLADNAPDEGAHRGLVEERGRCAGLREPPPLYSSMRFTLSTMSMVEALLFVTCS